MEGGQPLAVAALVLLCIGASSPASFPQVPSARGGQGRGQRCSCCWAGLRRPLALRGGGAEAQAADAAQEEDEDILAEDLEKIRQHMNWTVPSMMNREIDAGCAEGIHQMEEDLKQMQAERDKHRESFGAMEAEAAKYLSPEQLSELKEIARQKAQKKLSSFNFGTAEGPSSEDSVSEAPEDPPKAPAEKPKPVAQDSDRMTDREAPATPAFNQKTSKDGEVKITTFSWTGEELQKIIDDASSLSEKDKDRTGVEAELDKFYRENAQQGPDGAAQGRQSATGPDGEPLSDSSLDYEALDRMNGSSAASEGGAEEYGSEDGEGSEEDGSVEGSGGGSQGKDEGMEDEGGAGSGGGRAAYSRQVGKELHEEAMAMKQHAEGNCPKHHG